MPHFRMLGKLSYSMLAAVAATLAGCSSNLVDHPYARVPLIEVGKEANQWGAENHGSLLHKGGRCVYQCVAIWYKYLARTSPDYLRKCPTNQPWQVDPSIIDSEPVSLNDEPNYMGGLAAKIEAANPCHYYFLGVGTLFPQLGGNDSANNWGPTLEYWLPKALPGVEMRTTKDAVAAIYSSLKGRVVPVSGPMARQPVILLVNGPDPANPSTVFTGGILTHAVLVTGMTADPKYQPLRVEIVDPNIMPTLESSGEEGVFHYSWDIPGRGAGGAASTWSKWAKLANTDLISIGVMTDVRYSLPFPTSQAPIQHWPPPVPVPPIPPTEDSPHMTLD